jgi:hypothetical protein
MKTIATLIAFAAAAAIALCTDATSKIEDLAGYLSASPEGGSRKASKLQDVENMVAQCGVQAYGSCAASYGSCATTYSSPVIQECAPSAYGYGSYPVGYSMPVRYAAPAPRYYAPPRAYGYAAPRAYGYGAAYVGGGYRAAGLNVGGFRIGTYSSSGYGGGYGVPGNCPGGICYR